MNVHKLTDLDPLKSFSLAKLHSPHTHKLSATATPLGFCVFSFLNKFQGEREFL